jgi:succinyl-diaminopimelate desuccinylase
VVELETFLTAASELLAVPSTAERPEQLRRALDFVLDFVGPGFTVERFESNGKPSALLYRGPLRTDFRIILNAHLDVVPGRPEQFRPRREGGRIFGRGAHDMKVAALVQAQVFRELAATLDIPIALQLVTDEELGGTDGTRHQLEQGVTGQFVIIGENSGLDLVVESRGIARASLHAVGRGGHGAYPWLGDNAVLKLLRSVQRLMDRYPEPAAEVWRTTVNVAWIDTDNRAANQIPARAEARLDIRFPPEDTDFDGRTVQQVTAYLAACCEPGVSVVVHRLDPPHWADRTRPEIVALRKAAQDQGFPGGFLRKHGAADGRFYSQRGIDAIVFGIGGGGQHGPDEYVEIATILPYYRALTQFLIGLDVPA